MILCRYFTGRKGLENNRFSHEKRLMLRPVNSITVWLNYNCQRYDANTARVYEYQA